MNDKGNETIEKILKDSDYDDAREDTLWSMISQFYGKRMRSTAILVWAFGLAFTAMAAGALVMFFRVDAVRMQIFYAALFVCGVQMVALMKIFAWQMIHRTSVKRDIKRLEARLAAMSKADD